MGAFHADLRYALRILRRSPGFTLAAIVVIALGIGATTAIFSLVNGILLRPLSLPDSERLLALCEQNPSVPQGYCIASPPQVMDWEESSRTLSSVGVGRDWEFNVQLEGRTVAVSGGIADPGFFRTLGIEPARGRIFAEDEMGEGHDQVVLVSHAFWQGELGGDPDVVGTRVVLDGVPNEVIGVLPAGARVPTLEDVRVWKPLHFDPRDEEVRRWRGFLAVGRMTIGVASSAVQDELAGTQARLAQTHPETVRGWDVLVKPLRSHLVRDVRQTLLFFQAAVALVLVIACANVANLLLARAVRRQRELAVRGAMGASRARLAGTLLAEAVVLALAGGALGLLIANALTGAFVALAPAGVPRLGEVGIDATVLGFAFGISLLTAVAFGTLPALRGARVEVVEMLKEGARGSSGGEGARTRGALIVGELALTMALLVDAGLLARSFANLQGWEPGFRREHLVTLPLFLSRPEYSGLDAVAAFEEVESHVAGLPGVVSVGATSAGPIFGGIEPTRVWRSGQEKEEAPVARYYDVSPGYFQTLGLPLLAGRAFTRGDGEDAPPVAIVNETLARRLFAGGNPVGQQVLTFDGEESRTILGVIGDVRPFEPEKPVEPQVFFPKRQFPRSATFLIVRTAGEPAGLAGAVRDRIGEVDPAISIGTIRTMEDLVGRRLVRPRFNMLLVGSFALLALILASVGIYGVLAYTVAQRTREIGIRMALGARRTRVVRTVVGQGMALAGIGLLLGLALALLTGRGLASLLHGVKPSDPLTLLVTPLCLFAISALACFLPARRASRVDPAIALRSE